MANALYSKKIKSTNSVINNFYLAFDAKCELRYYLTHR
jgi:hypothetical protein